MWICVDLLGSLKVWFAILLPDASYASFETGRPKALRGRKELG